MGGACSTYREQINAYTALWWGKLKERGHEEYLGAGNRIILKLGLRTNRLGK
jgi:hypothetical protein